MRKAYAHPGAEVLWYGLQKLDVAMEMYLIYHPDERVKLRCEYPPRYLWRPPDERVNSSMDAHRISPFRLSVLNWLHCKDAKLQRPEAEMELSPPWCVLKIYK